ncbi:MAG: monovalent cation/H+ antiporter subunit D family protein [Alphaproteobacteria bacterium]|nr:monovalent cation/H+ antiporter subunit D family protein [Alphaproteobacteria bacterium]
MSVEQIILYAVLTPLAGAGLIALTGARPNLREAVTLATGLVLFALVANLYPVVAAGQTPSVSLLEMLPGLSLSFVIEPLGMIFAGIASFLWIVTSVYSIGYMRGHHEQNQTRFYVYFAIAISAAMGIAFAGNMLTLFVFYEVLTISTFPLVTHHGTADAKRAGRIYLGILMGTSILFLLVAVIWTWSLTGTLDFTKGGILAGKADGLTAAILLGLYVFGIGKAALMPFHRWLPAAMVAPTPVSALLHAVAVVKAGVFSVLKVAIYIFGADFLFTIATSRWLLYLAAATVLIASLVAMTKDNLKARLAYSTISQLSYIVLGAMLATDLGILGGGMHIAMHAFGKITLFFCAGAFLVAAHKTEISEMHGIGRTMPFTTLAFFIGSLSIIGLPPTGGLWSKWYLALGALEAGQIAIVAVLMISSLLNVFYLLQIPFNGFFSGKDGDKAAEIKEAPVSCLIAIGISSTACMVLFLYPDPVYDLMRLVVGS